MSYLDTGDNPTKRQKALKNACKQLEQAGYRTLLAVDDTTKRRHSFKMRGRKSRFEPDETFYLVARATRPFRGHVVSIQKSLVERAWREGHQIIMCVKGDYLIFNPENILSYNHGTNKRFGVAMLNFDVKSGREWTLPEVS